MPDNLLVFDSYGLGAAVISKDPERCDRVSKVGFIFVEVTTIVPCPTPPYSGIFLLGII